MALAFRHKTNILSYLTILSNNFFLFKSFEEKGVQKSVFKDYFITNKIAGSGGYAKMFHRKY